MVTVAFLAWGYSQALTCCVTLSEGHTQPQFPKKFITEPGQLLGIQSINSLILIHEKLWLPKLGSH